MSKIKQITLLSLRFIVIVWSIFNQLIAMESINVELWTKEKWQNYGQKVLPSYIKNIEGYKSLNDLKDPEKLVNLCLQCAEKVELKCNTVELLYLWGDFSSGAMCQVRASYVAMFGNLIIKDSYFTKFLYFLGETVIDCENIGCGITSMPKTNLTRLIRVIGEVQKKTEIAKYTRGAIEAIINARMFQSFGISFESLTWIPSINGTVTCLLDFYSSYKMCVLNPLMNNSLKAAVLLLKIGEDPMGLKDPTLCNLLATEYFFPLGKPSDNESFIIFEMYSAYKVSDSLILDKCIEEVKKKLNNPESFQEIIKMIAAYHNQFPKNLSNTPLFDKDQPTYKEEAIKTGIGITNLVQWNKEKKQEETVLPKDQSIPLNILHVYAANLKILDDKIKRYAKFIKKTEEK